MKSNSRYVVTFVLILLFSIAFLPSNTTAAGIFKAQPTIQITPERNSFKGLDLNEEVNTTLILTYNFPRFSVPSGYLLLSPSPTIINLEVTEKPKWCEVQLERKSISVKLPLSCILGGNVTFEVKIYMEVISRYAPGYSEGKINIKASASKNGNMQPCEGTCTIKVSPGFYPDVRINQSEIFVEISPGEDKEIGLRIENLGNMDIIVDMYVENESKIPDILSVNLSRTRGISVGTNSSRVVYIELHAGKVKRKVKEIFSIPLKISYHAEGFGGLKGPDIDIMLNVKVEGGEESSNINPVLITGVIAVIFIILLVSFVKKIQISPQN